MAFMPNGAKINTDSIWTALKEVIDPELGVNIVDLGLVYEVNVHDNGFVEVEMTLTTPACPLSSYFERVIPITVSNKVNEVGSVLVTITWNPPWQPQMMSDEAKRQMGWTT